MNHTFLSLMISPFPISPGARAAKSQSVNYAGTP
jgi:hypothetical protein